MSNNVFPILPLQSLDLSVRPEYRTKVLQAVSGKELRVSWSSSSRTTYTLRFDAARTVTSGRGDYNSSTGAWTVNPSGAYTEYSVIQAFLDTHRGSWDSFLFVDPISGSQVRVRLIDGSITYSRIASGAWAISSLQLIQVL